MLQIFREDRSTHEGCPAGQHLSMLGNALPFAQGSVFRIYDHQPGFVFLEEELCRQGRYIVMHHWTLYEYY